jgi:transposase-like protein
MKKNKSAVLDALQKAATSEALSVAFLENQRWDGNVTCPRCEASDVYQMGGRDGQRNKDYRWRCRACSKFFTVRTGTIFEETRLPLRVWVTAFWKICASKKGVSALQLSREMEISHKSALFVLRRIRHGMGEVNQSKLIGTIEADELFMGGKARYAGESKAGRGSNKYPILGVVQRSGDVRFHALERLTADRIGEFIAENADLSCTIWGASLRAVTR